MPSPTVAIVLGSDSDWQVMEACYQQLRAFDVPVEVEVISAHRTPERLCDYVRAAGERDIGLFIAAAGMAAALPGAIAALTTRPVIGVPLISGALGGIDSLLSMVQMPPGVPVATVAIGPAGATNAALLAIQILAMTDSRLMAELEKSRRKQVETVDTKSQILKERLRGG